MYNIAILVLQSITAALILAGEKRFDCIEDLVQDGLITLYLQKHDVAKVMEEGRNKTMVRREQSRRLRRQDGRSVNVG